MDEDDGDGRNHGRFSGTIGVHAAGMDVGIQLRWPVIVTVAKQQLELRRLAAKAAKRS